MRRDSPWQPSVTRIHFAGRQVQDSVLGIYIKLDFDMDYPKLPGTPQWWFALLDTITHKWPLAAAMT